MPKTSNASKCRLPVVKTCGECMHGLRENFDSAFSRVICRGPGLPLDIHVFDDTCGAFNAPSGLRWVLELDEQDPLFIDWELMRGEAFLGQVFTSDGGLTWVAFADPNDLLMMHADSEPGVAIARCTRALLDHVNAQTGA